jgi:predicted nucleic acid-binding protein
LPGVLFDSSICIALLRSKNDPSLHLRRMGTGAPIWFSSVVLDELYAGAGGKGTRVIERLERDFDKARRILVPNLRDWTQAGKALARLAEKYVYEQIGRGRLTNDALLATSAGRLGITVVSANARDFARLAEFLRFTWRVDITT